MIDRTISHISKLYIPGISIPFVLLLAALPFLPAMPSWKIMVPGIPTLLPLAISTIPGVLESGIA